MATSTPNYQFRKPDPTDFVDEDLDLNDNWDIVDTELDAVADRVTILEAKPKVIVVKSVDEVVTSSTTFQNDDELLFAAVAGTTYIFEFFLSVDGGAGRDFQLRLTHPTGTLVWGVMGPSLAAIASTGNTATDMNVFSETVTGGTSTGKDFGLSDDADINVMVRGSFVCTANGNVQLQWAQSASSASQVTVKKGSWLRSEVA